MAIGRIVSVGNENSGYARVRDEYGQEYSVHDSELPEEAKSGDEFAYRVDIWSNKSGSSTTLKAEDGEG